MASKDGAGGPIQDPPPPNSPERVTPKGNGDESNEGTMPKRFLLRLS